MECVYVKNNREIMRPEQLQEELDNRNRPIFEENKVIDLNVMKNKLMPVAGFLDACDREDVELMRDLFPTAKKAINELLNSKYFDL